MKRILAFFLVAVTMLSLCACEAEGEEIARTDFIIDGNKDVGDGFDSLKQFLAGVFDDPDDIKEMAGNNAEAVVEFDDAVYLQIGENVFPTRMLYYAISVLKSSEISEAQTNSVKAKDNDEYWNSLVFDHYKTRKELLLEAAKENVTNMLITMDIMKEYGFTESNNYIYSYESILANYGSEQAIEDYFGAYGLSAELYKKYLRYISAYNEFKEYLIGADGPLFPSDDEVKKHFYERCMYFEQIYISYTTIDENGFIVYKSDEEIQAARERGEKLYAQIQQNPEMFDRSLYLTEHSLWSENPMGYCYAPGEIIPELENLYFDLDVGEIGVLDSPIGYYIIRPKEKTDEVYEGNNMFIAESLRTEMYQKEIDKYRDKLIVNEDQFTRYDYLDIILLS